MNVVELKASIYAKLNLQVDLPFIDEDREEVIIQSVASGLVDSLPVELLPLLLDASDGITQREYDANREAVVAYINSKIDVPYLMESAEARLIGILLDAAMAPLLEG